MQPSAASEPLRRDPSSKTREVLVAVDDEELRRQIEVVVQRALQALAALGRIHLPQDQFEEGDAAQVRRGPAPGGDTLAAGMAHKHVELAPYVLAAIAAINELTDVVASTFPPPAAGGTETSTEDFDLEFDLVDGPTGEGAGLTGRKPSPSSSSPRERAAEVAHALAGMLRSRVAGFAARLRYALAQADAWPLLAELDDHKRSLTKGVQGLLFGVLGIFDDTVRREEILPEYRSAVREAVDLRAALTDLAYHIGRFNNALSSAEPVDLVPLVVGITDRLARFSARPEYRTLRPEDKKSVIEFRRALHRLRHQEHGIPLIELRHAVEGFAKFLEAMQAINHREVLVVHDKQRLTEALERLEESRDLARLDPPAARGRLQGIVRLVSAVIGRHPDLDRALRSYPPAAGGLDDLPKELDRWRALVQAALAAVG